MRSRRSRLHRLMYRRAPRTLPLRRTTVFYQGRGWVLAAALVLIAAALTAGVGDGQVLFGSLTAVLLLLLWLVYALRWRRLLPAGPGGRRRRGPGGAGVREPRRPLPKAPAGAAAMDPGA